MPNPMIPVDGEAMPETTMFLAITPVMRRRLVSTVENLIALLDDIDGDENLEEEGDDEPTLGWTGNASWGQRGGDDDREEECEDEGSIDSDAPGFIWGGNEGGKEARP